VIVGTLGTIAAVAADAATPAVVIVGEVVSHARRARALAWR
jgi:siroheme synthase